MSDIVRFIGRGEAVDIRYIDLVRNPKPVDNRPVDEIVMDFMDEAGLVFE